MALNWSAENVKNAQEVTTLVLTEDDPAYGYKKGDSIWHPVTMALVYGMVGIGMGEITEENADEFFARISFQESLDGPYLVRKGGEPHNITPEEVRAHIGLSANVSFESRTKWLGRFKRDLDRRAASYRRAIEKQPVA